jgi:hypothetical protein
MATPAYALFDDHVEIFAAENITHDSNVMRLSKNLTPESVGATQLGDTVYSTQGISGNLQWSQQLFTAEYALPQRLQDCNDLDFTGHTARAHWQWLWARTRTARSDTRAVGLSSFNNIQSRGPTSSPRAMRTSPATGS